ncbi:MAG: LCCL domain-containing protein, partial [Pseudomonadota bacterium]
ACRFAPARVTHPAGAYVADFEHPTACVVADADRAVSYVMGAALGGLSGLAAAPVNPKAAVALGAAIGLASTGVTEAVLEGVNTSINIWGIFWVDDASCGTVPTYTAIDGETQLRLATGQLVQATAAPPAQVSQTRTLAGVRSPTAEAISSCPSNAVKLRNTGHSATCSCSAAMTQGGQVWGSGPYTDDSNLCRAAVHAGVIPATGGAVAFEVVSGLPAYQGSVRHGVTSSSYGTWPGAVVVRRP